MKFFNDIIKEYPYKTELHCHTSPVSRCSQITPEHMIATYKLEGYSGLALTNHFLVEETTEASYQDYVDTYLKGYYDLREIGEKEGVKVYLALEIRFEENHNDYLVYGIDEDFIRYAVSPKMKTLKDFMSTAKRDENLIVQAHPFRSGMVLMPPELLDGYEVYNVHPGHNARIGFAAKYAEEVGGVFTCGTDYHHHGQDTLSALLTREVPEDSFDLARYIKSEPIYKVGCSIVTF